MQQPQLLDKTVLPEYKSDNPTPTYDSIDQIQQKLIEQLIQLDYKYARELTTEKDYVENLRRQLEHLNTKRGEGDFSDSEKEWDFFYRKYIEIEGDTVERKLKIIQHEGYPTHPRSEDPFSFIDKSCWENNSFQIAPHPILCSSANIKQLNVLINGFPLVHIVLLSPKNSLEQGYKEWRVKTSKTLNRLFGYIHIFVLTNGIETKWYVAELDGNTSQDFKNITNYWTDQKHTPIKDINAFALYFFKKEIILKLLTKYCIITEKKLIILKPYQIDAAESICNHILAKKENSGNKSAGGYVWHSTGSGKTLTAFMSCKLIGHDVPWIEKIFLLEDRNALEFQVNEEFTRFASGQDYGGNQRIIWADEGEKLSDVLENPNKYKQEKIVLTTIQKLFQFCKNDEKTSELFDQKVAFIIDECHRNNFGEMHAQIIKKFKQYFIFGFTGTPIFPENASTPEDTTENYFGGQIGPSYTIYRSIKDGNTLRFWLFEPPEDDESKKLTNSDTPIKKLPKGGLARVKAIAKTVWEEFESKTVHNGERFNGILAVQDIDSAIDCYNEFKKLNEKSENGKKLMVACVFTASKQKDKDSYKEIRNSFRREFETLCIGRKEQGWNQRLRRGDAREEVYKEVVTEAFKEGKIDLLIVAEMFLTGFDAPKLNTLWIDKPSIKWHTLIQAFSRTNRWHRNKEVGKIVSFNHISSAVDAAVRRFSEIDDDISNIYKTYTEEDFWKNTNEIKTKAEELGCLKKEIEGAGGRAEDHKEKKFIKETEKLEKDVRRLRNFGGLYRDHFGEEGEEELKQFTTLKEKLIKERAREGREDFEDITIEIPEELEEATEEDISDTITLKQTTDYSDKLIKLIKFATEKAKFSENSLKKLKKAIASRDKDLINFPGWISRKTNIAYSDPRKKEIVEEIIKLSNEIMEEMEEEVVLDSQLDIEDVT
ncbi:HsdR family type I site-specific deoxyribonuclease [Mycoplasma wenyonii str. Massachusetts]|uniref:Type I restriction enzyme endonuclease subunit n=1 Tax=Mycoplasma wenyonii (strain Massachusetts) TaxID=1197325 RepID=I6YB77_MYCWM|nr:HsdR family type I site-specific deoxyribonuclease [Mycoplasma wenyonii]AFN65226.1 HsdR family type I site-specific deoxyribonuclease [Mycoplasma wenyonii str. Massachusetts]